MEQYLTKDKLIALTGEKNLEGIAKVEMKVDTRESSIANLGTLMPSLQLLKLSNSIIPSIRDLGTALTNVKVLWLARCGLRDVEGIASSFPKLKELYLAFNDIEDLSPLAGIDTLEVLDLEGNAVCSIDEVGYLTMCDSLTSLTLEGAPVAAVPGYRHAILNMVPKLQVLDDYPVSSSDRKQPTPPPGPAPEHHDTPQRPATSAIVDRRGSRPMSSLAIAAPASRASRQPRTKVIESIKAAPSPHWENLDLRSLLDEVWADIMGAPHSTSSSSSATSSPSAASSSSSPFTAHPGDIATASELISAHAVAPLSPTSPRAGSRGLMPSRSVDEWDFMSTPLSPTAAALDLGHRAASPIIMTTLDSASVLSDSDIFTSPVRPGSSMDLADLAATSSELPRHPLFNDYVPAARPGFTPVNGGSQRPSTAAEILAGPPLALEARVLSPPKTPSTLNTSEAWIEEGADLNSSSFIFAGDEDGDVGDDFIHGNSDQQAPFREVDQLRSPRRLSALDLDLTLDDGGDTSINISPPPSPAPRGLSAANRDYVDAEISATSLNRKTSLMAAKIPRPPSENRAGSRASSGASSGVASPSPPPSSFIVNRHSYQRPASARPATTSSANTPSRVSPSLASTTIMERAMAALNKATTPRPSTSTTRTTSGSSRTALDKVRAMRHAGHDLANILPGAATSSALLRSRSSSTFKLPSGPLATPRVKTHSAASASASASAAQHSLSPGAVGEHHFMTPRLGEGRRRPTSAHPGLERGM